MIDFGTSNAIFSSSEQSFTAITVGNVSTNIFSSFSSTVSNLILSMLPNSVFYEIKKWVNNYEKIEEVYDEKGNIAFVLRKEILKQYFYYIIQSA